MNDIVMRINKDPDMSLLSCPLSGPVAPDRIEAVELTPQEPVCDTVEVRRVVGTCQDLLKVKGPIGGTKLDRQNCSKASRAEMQPTAM